MAEMCHNAAKKGGALYSEFPDTAYIFLAVYFCRLRQMYREQRRAKTR